MLKANIKRLAIASFAIGGLMLSSSCTSMVTDEQLVMLGDLRDQKASLQAEIKRVQADTRALQSELTRKKSEADDCDRKKKFVESKLKNWPDVWPDYNPNEKTVQTGRRSN